MKQPKSSLLQQMRRRDLATLSCALVCLALASACNRPDTEGSDTPVPANDTKVPESASAAAAPKCRDDINALHQLEGKTEAHVIAAYGEPSAQETFKMADCCLEFEIELYNTYPPGKGHDAVEIHQITWQDGDSLLTVWAHRPKSEWVILDTFCYSTGDEF